MRLVLRQVTLNNNRYASLTYLAIWLAVLKQIILNNNRYASLTYLGLKVFYKYHYFLQETGRLSSLTNSINLYSLCCTFAVGGLIYCRPHVSKFLTMSRLSLISNESVANLSRDGPTSKSIGKALFAVHSL